MKQQFLVTIESNLHLAESAQMLISDIGYSLGSIPSEERDLIQFELLGLQVVGRVNHVGVNYE